MDLYSGHINKLIEELAALPGIGSKSAQRLAFHLISLPKEKVERLTNSVLEAQANVRYCRECSDARRVPSCSGGGAVFGATISGSASDPLSPIILGRNMGKILY